MYVNTDTLPVSSEYIEITMSTDAALSVSERLLPLTTGDCRRFIDVNDGLLKFIDYLDLRHGSDIHGEFSRHHSIVIHRMLVQRKSGQEIASDDMDEAWFSRFERDPELISVLTKFLSHNGLVQ